MGFILGFIHWCVALGLMVFLLPFATLVAIFLLLAALIPAIVARNKGKSFALWYAYGINLWIVAVIHALVIPGKPQTVIIEHRNAPETATHPTAQIDDQAVLAALNLTTDQPANPAALQPGQSMEWRGVPVRNETGALQVKAGGQWRVVADQTALDSALDSAGAAPKT
ncbi:MAG: hypothetical protein AAF234_16120 [Pseudomonadota bacterium]